MTDNTVDSGKFIELPKLSDSGFLRQPDILKIFPFSPATLWRKVKAGKFPAPIKLSDRITAWRESDVKQYLETLNSNAV